MIEIEKYHGQYVELALACGSYGWGRVMHNNEGTFLLGAKMNGPVQNPNGSQCFREEYIRNVKEGQSNSSIEEIDPEQITRIKDITDLIES